MTPKPMKIVVTNDEIYGDAPSLRESNGSYSGITAGARTGLWDATTVFDNRYLSAWHLLITEQET
jgi:hypothetical protein